MLVDNFEAMQPFFILMHIQLLNQKTERILLVYRPVVLRHSVEDPNAETGCYYFHLSLYSTVLWKMPTNRKTMIRPTRDHV